MGLAAQKKPKIERDRFTEDGVRLFNATKEHGVIYCDGFMEAKYIQEYEGEPVMYRGDGAPLGYEKGVPMPKKADELLSENEALQARIRDLEGAQAKTHALLERLLAQQDTKAPPPGPGTEPNKPTPSQLQEDADRQRTSDREAPARAGGKPKQ